MCHEIKCGCGYSAHHFPREEWRHHGGCGCGHSSYRQRHFPTREEVIARLEEYLKDLQVEAKGVEEHIAELRKRES